MKVYGQSDGKEQYVPLNAATTTVNFNASTLGTTIRRITLQYTDEPPFTTTVKRATLIKADGTEQSTMLNKFWGCTVSLNSTSTDIPTIKANANSFNQGIYNLQGQKVTEMKRGIYIRNGKKIVVTRE